jgi:hypothetical protein
MLRKGQKGESMADFENVVNRVDIFLQIVWNGDE